MLPCLVPEPPDEFPQGLVFPGLRDRPNRGPLLAFLAVVLVAGIALIWPVYPLARSIRPYVLGFPFSFAWVIAWLVIVFVALVWYYRTDEPDAAD